MSEAIIAVPPRNKLPKSAYFSMINLTCETRTSRFWASFSFIWSIFKLTISKSFNKDLLNWSSWVLLINSLSSYLVSIKPLYSGSKSRINWIAVEEESLLTNNSEYKGLSLNSFYYHIRLIPSLRIWRLALRLIILYIN